MVIGLITARMERISRIFTNARITTAHCAKMQLHSKIAYHCAMREYSDGQIDQRPHTARLRYSLFSLEFPCGFPGAKKLKRSKVFFFSEKINTADDTGR